MRLDELPLCLRCSMLFFRDHRSTKLIIPERYDRSICSSWTFKPACPLKPVRRHSVLRWHSKQFGGVCLRPSSPMGKTISSSPKQSGLLSFGWFIGCWIQVTGCRILVFLDTEFSTSDYLQRLPSLILGILGNLVHFRHCFKFIASAN